MYNVHMAYILLHCTLYTMLHAKSKIVQKANIVLCPKYTAVYYQIDLD